MGAWFSLNGSVKVRKCPEVDAIYDRLAGDEFFNEFNLDQEVYEDGSALVSISGGDKLPYSKCNELENTLMELGPFTLEAGFLVGEYENDRCEIYIGPPEKQAEARSSLRLAQILEMTDQLTPKDRAMLKESL